MQPTLLLALGDAAETCRWAAQCLSVINPHSYESGDVTASIELYLKKKQKEIRQLKPSPIILRWLKSPRMKRPLAIIDKHVEYLLNNHGGAQKLKQWFLAGDENLNAVTAERYIIHYLQSKNTSITDNLSQQGIDACLEYDDGPIGIEITTLNSFIAEWILIERLTQILDESGYLSNKSLDVTYSHERIDTSTKGGRIYNYIENASRAIMTNNLSALSELELIVEINDRPSGDIFFHLKESDSLPWYQCITTDLWSKLTSDDKPGQLEKFPRNIVFVGLNHVPSDGIFPHLFENFSESNLRFSSEIQQIKAFWASNTPELKNVIGICYFFYSLENESPFYPLKMIWRRESERIPITL